MRTASIAALVLFLTTGAVLAQAEPAERNKALVATIESPAMSYEEAVAKFARVVRLYDRDGDGLTDAELDVADQIALAAMRASSAAALLPGDLDNNQRITAEEWAIVARAGALGRQGVTFEDLDINRDGELDWAEMSEWRVTPIRNLPKQQLRETSLDLDPTPETPFTLADATVLADELFALADLDGDRVIDNGERGSARAALRTQRQDLSLAERPVRNRVCSAPRPAADDQVIVLGGYEGVAYASSYLGAPDEPTYVVDVTVGPGEAPIYVMATSYHSVIWNFVGATERVRHVLLTGYYSQGALGVPREAVSFEAAGDCFSADYDDIGKRGDVASFVGSDRFVPVSAYELYRVNIPSGKIEEAPKPTVRFVQPVAQVAADRIVSEQPARPYEVLPGRAGFAQLLASGAMVEVGKDVYRIIKPIPHFPADLGGAHSVTFLIAPGVPMPAGSAGHSCVRIEATGEVAGLSVRCR
jgi:hypothetical protein